MKTAPLRSADYIFSLHIVEHVQGCEAQVHALCYTTMAYFSPFFFAVFAHLWGCFGFVVWQKCVAYQPTTQIKFS